MVRVSLHLRSSAQRRSLIGAALVVSLLLGHVVTAAHFLIVQHAVHGASVVHVRRGVESSPPKRNNDVPSVHHDSGSLIAKNDGSHCLALTQEPSRLGPCVEVAAHAAQLDLLTARPARAGPPSIAVYRLAPKNSPPVRA